jgi:hypothetical protein
LKPIAFSRHARDQMAARGVRREEAISAIRSGQRVPAKAGRQGYERTFPHGSMWQGRAYANNRVLVVVSEEPSRLVVVTVYSF